MSATLEITQVRSTIGSQDAQRRTLRSLGLRRIHQTVTQPDRPEIRGMLAKVAHLVQVTYAGDGEALDLEPGQEPKGVGNPPAGPSVEDEESAEIAEAVEEALSVEGSVDDVADLVENPPSLSATDGPTKPKPRGADTGEETEEPTQEEEGS
jgi:large subunit ribosomal protein L30